jgi:dienelactone hydrolase
MSLHRTNETSWPVARLAAGALLLLGAACGDAGTSADEGLETDYEEAKPLAQEVAGDCPADAICHDEAPSASTSKAGSHKVEKYTIPRSSEHGGATVYWPSDVESFSGAVYCPPLTGVQAMYAQWGPFLASHGIALVTMDTRSTQDSVQSRGGQLAAMVKQFRGEATRSGSPINGKLNAQRVGTMGWSMGGGATWIAAAKDATLKSSISMAGHNATGGGAGNSRGTSVPSMQLAGQTDTSILGGMGQSQGVYGIIPESTPKILFVIRGVGHMSWGGPTAATAAAGEMTLAFQKTFLDGDTRWKKFLVKPANASEWKSNINP